VNTSWCDVVAEAICLIASASRLVPQFINVQNIYVAS